MLKHKVKIPQALLTQANIPSYLNEVILKVSDLKDNKVECVIKTPSAQGWNILSTAQQERWRGIIIVLGQDPEDYLQHLREMLPKSPKGAE